ncbi:hypothetical protein, partial [Paraburkholderia bannensis]|uniref:hypothetical protein n=1 Tax=Paraburkholderia bannensis TaxID=765414 RepID=UPI001C85E98C
MPQALRQTLAARMARLLAMTLRLMQPSKAVGLPLAARLNCAATGDLARCTVPNFHGAILSLEWKEALWAKFFTEAPQR